jgi:sn-glycerol 3-phosphate transport system permease protein
LRLFWEPLDGKARRLSLSVVAVSAGAAADRHHADLLLLPAGQALWQSMLQQDAFGINLEFVGLDNFVTLWKDPQYIESFQTTAIFAIGVTVVGLSVALLLAYFADRVVRAATGYKTLLIWPYAVAPAVAGVLWMFMFNPTLGVVSYALRKAGVDWNFLLNGNQALLLVVLAAAWKQVSYNFLFFLAGLQSIPKSLIEAAAIDGAGRGSASGRSCSRCCRPPPSSCS